MLKKNTFYSVLKSKSELNNSTFIFILYTMNMFDFYKSDELFFFYTSDFQSIK